MFHQNVPTTRTWKTTTEEWGFMDTTDITDVIIIFHPVGIDFAGQRELRCPHHV